MTLVIFLFCLLVFAIPIAIIVLIVQAIVKRNSKEDKKDFEEIIRGIYIYLILIITLVAIIAGVIITFRVGLDVVLPEKYITSTTYYNSQEREYNENVIELLTTISIVITSLPIFIYYNRLAKKDREIKKINDV